MVLSETAPSTTYSLFNSLNFYTKFIITNPSTDVFEELNIYSFHIMNYSAGFSIGAITVSIPIPDHNLYFGRV